METMKRLFGALASTRIVKGALLALLTLACASPAMAGEAELKIPVLGGSFLGMSGHNLLLIGLVICLLLRDRLTADGHAWWTWVCLAAALMGLPGLWFVRRRRAVYAAAKAGTGS